eukprot:scaffold2142_cov252-Pinguiococcus_pyrenoidosus.AAC.3
MSRRGLVFLLASSILSCFFSSRSFPWDSALPSRASAAVTVAASSLDKSWALQKSRSSVQVIHALDLHPSPLPAARGPAGLAWLGRSARKLPARGKGRGRTALGIGRRRSELGDQDRREPMSFHPVANLRQLLCPFVEGTLSVFLVLLCRQVGKHAKENGEETRRGIHERLRLAKILE